MNDRARVARLAAGLVVTFAVGQTGCAATDVELLRRDGSVLPGRDAPVAMPCQGGAHDCAACPPACTDDCVGCAAACTTGACVVGLMEGVGGAICETAAVCGIAGSAFDYCRGRATACVVTVSRAADVTCLDGGCNVRCEGPCAVDCPSGQCTLACASAGCAFRSCPVPVLSCAGGVTACAAACPG